MPQPIVRQPPRRIVSNIFLEPWLLPLVKSLNSEALPYYYKNPQRSRLLKIIKFLQISYRHGVKLIISDSDHLILAEIPRAVYLEHERKLRHRLTQNNKNVIILIKFVKFKFYSKQEVYKKFGILMDTKRDVELQKFCVVELVEFEFFNRDQVIDDVVMPWIYNDNEYDVYKSNDEAVQPVSDEEFAIIEPV